MNQLESATIISHLYSNPLVDCGDVRNSKNINQHSESASTDPVDILDHREEQKVLRDIVTAAQDKFPITLISVPATIENFQSCFGQSKILHFSGIVINFPSYYFRFYKYCIVYFNYRSWSAIFSMF
jgi:hypothetical protein